MKKRTVLKESSNEATSYCANDKNGCEQRTNHAYIQQYEAFGQKVYWKSDIEICFYFLYIIYARNIISMLADNANTLHYIDAATEST